MSRKDIIIIAVLANISVLAILFLLAFRTEGEKSKSQETAYVFMEEPRSTKGAGIEITGIKTEPRDEMDAFLEEVTPINSVASAVDDDVQFIDADYPTSQDGPSNQTFQEDDSQKFVDVTIKKGDALEKIARANGTTVDAIMKANNMRNDKLRVGQMLHIPVGTRKNLPANPAPPKAIVNAEEQYYAIKAGDNLWKIAKQFQVRVDDLLRFNNLDEDSARRLKAGDQIRVR